jgi:hypothetical protein
MYGAAIFFFEPCTTLTYWSSATALPIVVLPTVFSIQVATCPVRFWLGSLFFLVKRLEINEENGRSFFS